MDCPICFEELCEKNKMTLGCNHVFCSKCILLNLKTIRNCPLCRKPLNISSPVKINWNAISYMLYFGVMSMQFISILAGITLVIAIMMVTPCAFNFNVIVAVVICHAIYVEM